MAEVRDRASMLDAFASTGGAASMAAPPSSGALMPMMQGTNDIMGAQRVAVTRDEEKVLKKLKVLASAAGDDWFYRFPVKNRKEGRTDYIEGPSIKLANALARTYGNCVVDCRVIPMGEEWLIYAKFTDLETGFTTTRPFQQRMSQKTMGNDDGRQRDIALQIGVSKAIRNVVVNALSDYADFAYEEARNSLVTRIGSKLPDWRTKVADRLKDNGVDVSRAERVMGRPLADWTAPDVARVIAMSKAVTDGMATWDETFPPHAAETEAKGNDASLDKFGAEGGKPDAADHQAEGEQATAGTSEVQAEKSAETGKPTRAESTAKPANEVRTEAQTPHDPSTGEIAAEEMSPEQALELAQRRGGEARAKGMSYKAVPPEYRSVATLAKAWQDAWQAKDRAIHGGEQGER